MEIQICDTSKKNHQMITSELANNFLQNTIW